jgi:hypothetical protein
MQLKTPEKTPSIPSMKQNMSYFQDKRGSLTSGGIAAQSLKQMVTPNKNGRAHNTFAT